MRLDGKKYIQSVKLARSIMYLELKARVLPTRDGKINILKQRQE